MSEKSNDGTGPTQGEAIKDAAEASASAEPKAAEAAKTEAPGLFRRMKDSVVKPESISGLGTMVKENFTKTGWAEKIGRGAGAAVGAGIVYSGIKDMASTDEKGERHVFKGVVKTGLGAAFAAGSLALQLKGKGAAAHIG